MWLAYQSTTENIQLLVSEHGAKLTLQCSNDIEGYGIALTSQLLLHVSVNQIQNFSIKWPVCQLIEIAMIRAFSSSQKVATKIIHSNRNRSFAKGSELGAGIDVVDVDCFDPKTGKRRLQVKAFGENCFKLDEVMVRQSVLLFPHSFLLWSAKSFEEINMETLMLFPFLFPAVEVLFIGCGEVQPKQLSPELTKFFRSKGIVVEATSTAYAAGSFNVLNAEGRNVCAALLTQQPYELPPVLNPGEFKS